MDKLSVEILSLIFNYLNKNQKLQSKLVCKSWAHILRYDLDLGTVVIPSNECRDFIERMKVDKSYYKDCRRLTISDYYDISTLVTLFPNLNFLYFLPANNTDIKQKYDKEDDDQVFQHWHNNLRTLIDFSKYHLLFTFLNTGIFYHLTTVVLAMRIDNIDPLWCYKLKNAPNLTTLHVQGALIDLEYLHLNTPRLCSLVLSMCIIDPKRQGSNDRILPAETVTKFEVLKYAGQDGFSLDLSKYITKKYPNLKKFAFKMHECGKRGNKDRYNLWTSAFLFLIRSLKLTSFKTWLPISIPDIYTGFMQDVTFSLEKLTTNIFNDTLLLHKIIHICEVTDLQSLSLTQVPPLDRFKLFNELIHLKVLKLKFISKLKVGGGSKSPIELTKLINELPESVETLGLISVDLFLDSAIKKQATNIRHLKIKFATIMKHDISDYLSRYFKRLDTVILDRCTTKYNLTLPHHHLRLVKIDVYKYLKVSVNGKTYPKLYSAREHYASMKTFRRKAAFDVHDLSMYSTCQALPLKNNERFFHLTCASIHTLLLGEELVLL